MCAVSMIGDHYTQKWQQGAGGAGGFGTTQIVYPPPSREEFDALKKEVLDMKELLKRAKEYDEKTHQKDCETEQKLELLRQVAKAVGVDLEDVLGAKI